MMREISEIVVNGKPLAEILEDHKTWLSEPAGVETKPRAELSDANLSRANLSDANLSDANIDYSCWPLWCGSKDVKVDRKIAAQLAAHFCCLDCDDPDYIAARDAIMAFAKTSHRAVWLL
jgi:hypothetical protein